MNINVRLSARKRNIGRKVSFAAILLAGMYNRHKDH